MHAGRIRNHRFDRAAAQAGRGVDGRAHGRVLDRVVEQVVEDLVKALLIRRHRRYIVRNVQVERQLAGASPRPHDLQLLLELAAKVDGGDVQRDRARFHTRKVQQLLRHPKHHDALTRDVRRVAEEIAADPKYADDEQLGPDDGVRSRFREFARKQLGSA